jgi:hypothetical protein
MLNLMLSEDADVSIETCDAVGEQYNKYDEMLDWCKDELNEILSSDTRDRCVVTSFDAFEKKVSDECGQIGLNVVEEFKELIRDKVGVLYSWSVEYDDNVVFVVSI